MTRLADLVATSQQVAATPGRLAKVAALAGLLRRLAPEEIGIAVAYLAGETRQGKLGLGHAALRDARGGSEPRGEALTLADTDAALERLRATGGKGSAAARARAARCVVRPRERRRARLSRASDRRRAPPGRARGRDARRDREGGGPARRRRPPRRRCTPADSRRSRSAALTEGAAGLARFAIRAAASGAADARNAGGRRRRRARVVRHGRARVEARRRARPGPQGRRRGARLHPQPERRHRRRAGGRRGGAGAAGA